MRGWTSSLGGRFGARTGDSELGQEIRSSDGSRMHVHACACRVGLASTYSGVFSGGVVSGGAIISCGVATPLSHSEP